VELLHTEGAQAEPHTLKDLVTHWSEKFWLSHDCLYVCMSVHPYANTLKTESSTIPIATSLMLGIHAIVNWQLSQQAIHWPVSCEHIAGSGLALMEVVCFLNLTAEQLLVFRYDVCSSLVISLGEKEGVLANAKFWRKLTPGVLLTFLLTYSLHNRLLESPWYIAYVISTILVRLIRYSLLKFNWKK